VTTPSQSKTNVLSLSISLSRLALVVIKLGEFGLSLNSIQAWSRQGTRDETVTSDNHVNGLPELRKNIVGLIWSLVNFEMKWLIIELQLLYVLLIKT